MRWPYHELKARARYLFTGYTGILVQATLVCAAAFLASGYLSMFAGGTGILVMLISLITELFCEILTAGRIGMALDCGRSGQIKVSDVFVCFQREPDKLLIVNIVLGGIRLLFFYLTQTVLQLISIVAMSDALFIAAAIVVIGVMTAIYCAVRLSFALVYFLYFDHPKWSSMELLRYSREMMYGWKWQLFKIWFSFIGWYALCILSFGIGLLWVIPYVDLTTAQFYEEIFGREKQDGHY